MRSIGIACGMVLLAATAAADSSGLPNNKVTLELYDVFEWVDGRVEFPSAGAISIARPLPDEGFIDAQEFAHQLRAAVAAGQWDKRKGWSLECSRGLLVVRAPAPVHRALAGHLATLPTRPR